MLLVVPAGSPNLLSFLLLLTLLLMSRHVSCNDIHDATPTCCMTHPHYIPPPQVNHFLRIFYGIPSVQIFATLLI